MDESVVVEHGLLPTILAMPEPALAPSPQLDRILLQALAHTVNGVVITDATQPGNPIVHVNEGFSRLTGYTCDEVLGRNCNFLQGSEREQAEVAQMRQAIAAGDPITVVIRNFRKDGSAFWNQVELSPVRDDHSGGITHYFALQTDVTLKRQAERANILRAVELERIFRGGPVGMVLMDENGRASLATPALWRLMSLSALPIEGMTGPELASAVGAALSAKQGRPASPLPWPVGTQSVRWEVAQGATIRGLDVSSFELGSLTRERVIVVRDITQEEVDQAARSQFLATAAHELRTPMGSICGFTELLLMRNYSTEQARPLLETILRQSMRLSAMLNDLLDLSQMDVMGSHAFSPSAMPLNEALRKAVEVAVPPGSTRSIQLKLSEESVQVMGHPQKLEQVLINLLSNALKYSPQGGAVELQSTIDRSQQRAHIAVIDHGIGLSPEHQARLFTRFFRADPTGPISGTGLGLVIVKELVERMGGTIAVHSVLGQGSTFTVSLPLSESPT